MKYVSVVLLALSVPLIMLAHQPRNVESGTTTVADPEISKAYYATLQGEPHTYLISSDREFNAYVSVSVPLLDRAETDYLVALYALGDGDSKTLIHSLSASRENWEEFYEPFAGDMYLSGPKFDEQLPAGVYEIVVSSPDNEGQYVLAVGKIESFSLSEIVATYLALPGIKEVYFDKAWYTPFWNIMTAGLLVGFLAVLLGMWVVYRLWKITRRSLLAAK